MDIKIKIERIISNPSLSSESDVTYLMVLVRKYLEQLDNGGTDFFVLKFFCDWSLHPEIERSIPAMALLRDVNNIVVELKNIPNNKLIMDKITEIVSFQKLKQDLNKFFEHIGISDRYTTDKEKWNSFVSGFINVILDSPLILSNPKKYKRAKKIYEEIINNPIKKGTYAIGFTLSYVNNSFFKGIKEPSTHATLCLVLYLSDTTRIVIPLSKEFLL